MFGSSRIIFNFETINRRIHESLTKLQQEQLERLRQWLTATEDRISQLGAAQQPESAAAAVRMLEDHELLQKDLEAKQEYVNALSDIVVIVDESAGDSKKPLKFLRFACFYSFLFVSFYFARLLSNGRSAFSPGREVESRVPVGWAACGWSWTVG